MPKKVFRVVYAINYILQAAFSMLIPAGAMIFLGWLLTNRLGVGRWAMITAIVLGVLLGLYSMFYYLIKTANAIDPTNQGGNKHDGTV